MTEAGRFTEVASGLRFPEGPVVMPDGSIVVVEVAAGRVTRIRPDGSKAVLATPGGGPNGLALGPDGKLYLCNNGGFGWYEDGAALMPFEMYVFEPLRRKWSPLSSAVDRMPARSDPAPGSVIAMARIVSPLTQRGRNRSRCSSVPKRWK